MIPEVGHTYLVDHPRKSYAWDEVYPFKIKIESVDDNPLNSDKKWTILNLRTGHTFGVEDNWFNDELTGKIITECETEHTI